MQKINVILENFSQICLLLLIFVLFLLLPQINVSGYVQPTITSKLIYFLYNCIALIGFYTVYIFSTKKLSFSLSKLDLILFVLVIYITINRYGIQSDFGFSIRYVELLGLSFLYIVLRNFPLKNNLLLLLIVVISGIFQAVYGNLQLLGYCASNHSGFKMTGSFFNPGPYAGFLVSVWSVALGMYLFKDKIINQVQSLTKSNCLFLNEFIKQAFEYIPLLGLISIAIVIPATQSRAAWIAAISCSLVLVELRYNNSKNLFKKINAFKRTFLIVIFIGILSACLFGVYYLKKESSNGRAFIWKVTTEMITDDPVFGVGFDRFKAHYMNYQAHYFVENGETPEAVLADNSYYAFNEWLQFVAENGLLGFAFLVITILVLFKIKVKEEHHCWGLVTKTSLVTIGVFANFSYPMQILPIKIVLVFLLVMLSNSTDELYLVKIGENKNRLRAFKVVALLLGLFCMNKTIFYAKNFNQGFVIWKNALNSHQSGDYKEALTSYASVYTIFKNDGDFLMNYGKTLTLARDYSKAIEILEKTKFFLNNTIIETSLGDSYKAIKQYDKAEAAYQEAINMVPSKFYANYLLAKLYNDSKQKQKAVATAQKILNKKIKIPSIAIKEIRAEMKKILIKYKTPPGFKI